MRVKARLTNDAIEQVGTEPPNDPAADPDFQCLAALFDTDPLIAHDERSWYLSGSALDAADEERRPWALREAAEGLLELINGTAFLLRTGGRARSVRLAHEYDGRVYTGNSGRIYEVSLTSWTVDGLDPESARILMCLAVDDPWVGRILRLLQHVDREWVWFDLWRIWDVVAGHFPSRKAFLTWVDGLGQSFGDRLVSFENSANDHTLGDNRRHAKVNWIPGTTSTGDVAPPMNWRDAIEFVRTIALRWISRQHHVTLTGQP